MHRLLPVLAIVAALFAPWLGDLVTSTDSSETSPSVERGSAEENNTSSESGCSIDPWGGCP
jgi:hypothetical protein